MSFPSLELRFGSRTRFRLVAFFTSLLWPILRFCSSSRGEAAFSEALIRRSLNFSSLFVSPSLLPHAREPPLHQQSPQASEQLRVGSNCSPIANPQFISKVSLSEPSSFAYRYHGRDACKSIH